MAKVTTQALIDFPVRKTPRAIRTTPIKKTGLKESSPVKTPESSRKTRSSHVRNENDDVSPSKSRRLKSRQESVERDDKNSSSVDVKLNKLRLRTPSLSSRREPQPSTSSKKPKAAKSLFDINSDENVCKGSSTSCDSPKRAVRKTKPVDLNPYEKAKLTLNTSFLTELKYRETEYDQVKHFLTNCLSTQESGSLYVSGAPGTGKTFCVTRVIEDLREKFSFQSILVNCMGCRTPNSVYSKILTEAGLETPKKVKDSVSVVTEKLVTPRKGKKSLMTILTLDEIDELEDKNRDVLYTLFEWPRLEGSRLIVIGICNTLDFTTRSLKRYSSLKVKSIESINFQPYSKDQVKGIIACRLPSLEDGSLLVKDNALELCARKVSSFSGDIRKALHVIRRSIELVEMENKAQGILKQKADDGNNSPKKSVSIVSSPVLPVSVQHVMRVLNEVYASKALDLTKGNQSMPTQQQLALCVLLLLFKISNLKEVTVSKFHDTFVKVCCKKSMGFTVESRSEFLGMCQLLEAKGFVILKAGKETSLTKITLNVNEQEVDEAMTDKSLLKGILEDSSLLK